MASFRSISQNKFRIFPKKILLFLHNICVPSSNNFVLKMACLVFLQWCGKDFLAEKKHVLRFVHKHAFLSSKMFSFYLEKVTFIGICNILVDNFSQQQWSSVPKLYSSCIFQAFSFFIRAVEFHLKVDSRVG